jgi:hypothetical protein
VPGEGAFSEVRLAGVPRSPLSFHQVRKMLLLRL